MKCSLLLAIFLYSGCQAAYASPITEAQAVQCILGEARGEYREHGYMAFLAIASALRNRGTFKGVYGCTANMSKEVAFLRTKGYFKAARQAWLASATVDVVHGASHWESTDFKRPYWAADMKVVYQIGKHRFYK